MLHTVANVCQSSTLPIFLNPPIYPVFIVSLRVFALLPLVRLCHLKAPLSFEDFSSRIMEIAGEVVTPSNIVVLFDSYKKVNNCVTVTAENRDRSSTYSSLN